MVRRLVSSSPTKRLTKALTHLGQVVKTIYILRFLNDPTLRQQVRT
jgi:TnpA family transposase